MRAQLNCLTGATPNKPPNTLAALLLALPAQADLYKCKNASGKTTYSDLPCLGGNSATSSGSDKINQERIKTQKSAVQKPTTADEIIAMWGIDDGEIFVNSKIAASQRTGDGKAEAQSCMEKYRSNLKDPRSAYIVDSAMFRDSAMGEDFVAVDFSGKNALGGAVRKKLICTVSKDKSN